MGLGRTLPCDCCWTKSQRDKEATKRFLSFFIGTMWLAEISKTLSMMKTMMVEKVMMIMMLFLSAYKPPFVNPLLNPLL